MNLDPRIEKLSDILTCVDIEEAKQFIGQKGYFADVIDLFDNLEDRQYGALACADDCDSPFRVHGENYFWRYFLPESRLKPEKKKYRPYTLKEFFEKYKVGSAITIRIKNNDLVQWKLLITGHRIETLKDGTYYKTVYIGNSSYTLQELFDDYEIRNPDTDTFIPFGVKEE